MSDNLTLRHNDGRSVTQDDLENLWRAVVMQDTGERRAQFMVNWLRGTIKIPQEVELRIYNKVKGYRVDIDNEKQLKETQEGGA